ncbi:aspartate-semialdehyde dehydrogenase [Candidatus Micrarchaeota archaeon]|nr:aspartate-semialdehyde dehydrogenase [Candidatus Micrarchaeota archaeon]
MKKVDVALLGATGVVGQKFIQLLSGHPCLRLVELFASEKSAGKTLEEAAQWIVSDSIPEVARNIRIKSTAELPQSTIVFSALPGEVAMEVELRNAREGKLVVSKASALRCESDVPILVPEINLEHLEILKIQKKNRKSRGCVITDPNCTTTILTLSLAPLQELGMEEVLVTTMQAISGAGFPGVASLSIHDNVIPHISGEEEKVVKESKKILGKCENGRISEAAFKLFASCNRVPVIDGHTESVHVRFRERVDPENVKELMRNFRSLPQKLELHSAPKQPVIVRSEEDRPQPRLDRGSGNGMAVTVGRVREGIDERSVAFTVCGHNTVRGAAGASILDVELLLKTNMINELVGDVL